MTTNIPKPFFDNSQQSVGDKKINENNLDEIIKQMVELSKENLEIEEELNNKEDEADIL